jgi:hypothetical protein
VSREAKAKQRQGNEIEFSRIVAFSDGVAVYAIDLSAVVLIGMPTTADARRAGLT